MLPVGRLGWRTLMKAATMRVLPFERIQPTRGAGRLVCVCVEAAATSPRRVLHFPGQLGLAEVPVVGGLPVERSQQVEAFHYGRGAKVERLN
jgi:hypothetical protein